MPQLPWSTSNEDLIDLFSTIGKVNRAEIQYEGGGRSRGSGVVEFDSADLAETSISMSSPNVESLRTDRL
jgi:RNA recognition motif-containing protein